MTKGTQNVATNKEQPAKMGIACNDKGENLGRAGHVYHKSVQNELMTNVEIYGDNLLE